MSFNSRTWRITSTMIYVWMLCFLQLLTLTTSQQVFVEELSDEVKLSCKGKEKIKSKDGTMASDQMLSYKDENSGEYQCVNSTHDVTARIFVKFRTCENCIEMDLVSIIGVAIGDVVATIIIGVGVYIVASTTPRTSAPPNRKTSDGYPPVSHKARGDNNDPYQRLRHKGPKDIYEDLKTGR